MFPRELYLREIRTRHSDKCCPIELRELLATYHGDAVWAQPLIIR